jgi:hypothetical protein
MNRISVGASMSRLLCNLLAALVLASSPILATIPANAQDPGDPPADVARIAIISGSVSSHQPGSQDWEAAQQNYPLAPGSGVWTEPRAHAAVDVAGARVHLDASSQLEVTAINPGQVQLAVAQGAAVIRVYPGVSGVNFQVNTAHGTANISQPGQYEIVAGDDQHPATLSVIEGQAQFTGQNANLALQAGQRGTITPDSQSAVDAAQPDDFVRMVQQQEQPYQQQVAQTAQYVSPQQTGYQDLARYGQWDQAPQYGAVWYPQAVPANWAPYRYGHWAYVAPWGWTWVDDAPWGFTPFHYGRWVQVGHRWGWVPGQRVERPVYAPALVSFFDLGGGVNINVSLGWVPLAPEEVFVPYYRHSPRYVRAVNITNVRNETTIINVVNKKTVINYNKYENYRGATSVSRDVMEHGRAVAPAWGKDDKGKSDQQWSQAKPEQEVALQPQGNANGKHTAGPKFQPQSQSHQNWQSNAKPDAKMDSGAGKPKTDNPPRFIGQPKSNNAKPKNGTPEPYIPPVNGTAQKLDAPSGKAPAPVTNIPAPPKSSKSANAPQWSSNGQNGKNNNKQNHQAPVIYPTTTAKPSVQQQPQQEQTTKKSERKTQQQQVPQAQSKQQWKQPDQPKANQSQSQSGGQQQKKPGQDCGQQAGACQN